MSRGFTLNVRWSLLIHVHLATVRQPQLGYSPFPQLLWSSWCIFCMSQPNIASVEGFDYSQFPKDPHFEVLWFREPQKWHHSTCACAHGGTAEAFPKQEFVSQQQSLCWVIRSILYTLCGQPSSDACILAMCKNLCNVSGCSCTPNLLAATCR